MAWKRQWHVEATCPKCQTKKEVDVECRRDEVGHRTWNITFCELCKEWMHVKAVVSEG